MRTEVYVKDYEQTFRTFSRTDREEARYESQLLKKLKPKQRLQYLTKKGLSQ